jgi:hypothetical protein
VKPRLFFGCFVTLLIAALRPWQSGLPLGCTHVGRRYDVAQQSRREFASLWPVHGGSTFLLGSAWMKLIGPSVFAMYLAALLAY